MVSGGGATSAHPSIYDDNHQIDTIQLQRERIKRHVMKSGAPYVGLGLRIFYFIF